MKKRFLSLVLALGLCLTLMPAASAAEDLGEITRAEAEERFGITISPSHLDFGTVSEQSGSHTHEQVITITNGYHKPIAPVLFSVEFSPASAEDNLTASGVFESYFLSDSTPIVQPGESFSISVDLHTRVPGAGHATASIKIFLGYNDWYHEAEFTVTDAFTVDYEVLPFEGSLSDDNFTVSVDSLDFGTLNFTTGEGVQSQQVSRTFTVTNTGEFPFRLNLPYDGRGSMYYDIEYEPERSPAGEIMPGGSAIVTAKFSEQRSIPYNLDGVIEVTAEYIGYGDDPGDVPTVTKEIPVKATVLLDGGYRIVTDYDRSGYGTITDVNGTANYTGWYDGVAPGSDFTVCFRPTAGNHVLSVVVDGEPVGAVESYTFTNVQEGHQLDILFGQGPAPSSWAIDQVAEAVRLYLAPANLRNNYTTPITRSEFCALAVELYETVTGGEITARAQFSDTTDLNVQKMAGLGVVNGVGNGQFNPDGQLTREQAATMLARLAEVMGHPLPATDPTFADNASISSWAAEAVGQMQAAGIMDGTGNNQFSPQGSYTREQSILTALRLYETLR